MRNFHRQLASILQRYLTPGDDPHRERYRRAGLTATTSFIARGLTILTSFVSVPVTVHYLGAEQYGVWLTISSLLFWLALSDFGLTGSALVNVLSEAVGNDDPEAARQYTASAFWAMLTIAFIIGAVFTIGFHVIPWRAVFRVSDAISTQELEATCAFVLTLFVIKLPLTPLRSLYVGHQEGYLADIWLIAYSVVSLLGLIVVTRFHGGLPQLVLGTSGISTLVLLANAYHVFFRQYPWLAPAFSAVRWTCIRRLLKLGWKYMTIQLASLGVYQSQAIIITQILGPSSVVIFVVTAKVITLPVDLAYMGTVPFVSAFGEAKARRHWDWIKGAFKNGTLACVGLGVPLTATLALVAKPLILTWAGPSAVPDPLLVLWLFTYSAIGISFMMPGQLLTGVERPERLGVSMVLCALGSMGFGVLFAPFWGLSGIAFGMTASELMAYWPILREVRRIFRLANSAVPGADPRPAT